MNNPIAYYLASAVLVLALPATPALAREHTKLTQHNRHRQLYAAAGQQTNSGPSGMQLPFSFAAPMQTPQGAEPNSVYAGMVAQQASANGVPASLVHRVIMRESRYNARAVSGGNYGIMQIRLGTARAMGYSGSAAGLLDPATNMTYAVRYLAGAYRAAGGNEDRAVALYARGYYQTAKAQGFSPYASGS